MQMADHPGTRDACFNNGDDPKVQRVRMIEASDYAFELDNIREAKGP